MRQLPLDFSPPAARPVYFVVPHCFLAGLWVVGRHDARANILAAAEAKTRRLADECAARLNDQFKVPA